MANWDAKQYSRFEAERTQPAVDLLGKAGCANPERVLDIGCGPGNSTLVLRRQFPSARLTGVDSSADMLKKAKQNCPGATYLLCDVAKEPKKLGTGYDLVFSNACLQWIPHHEKLIPGLMQLLNKGGVLAVQVPMNGESPLYRVMDRVLAEEQWGFANQKLETSQTLAPEQYFSILAANTSDFALWESVYYHRMASHADLIDWVKGTKLRPYLAVLDKGKQEKLVAELTREVKSCYPVQANGEIIFTFRRFFFTARVEKGANIMR